jgi:hypothetical protein
MKKRLATVLIFFITAAAFSADFGLTLGTEGEYAGGLAAEGFSFTGNLSPWFSAAPAETINVYVSGKMTFEYGESQEPQGSYFFEVERTEMNLRPVPGFFLTLGRLRFQDNAGLVASGLFDGAEGSLNLGVCRLSLGAFYTGLLYKETAKIIMTPSDLERYGKPLDTEGLEGYFASRRVLLALTGEFPDLMPWAGLTAQVIAQFDINDASDFLNSQYLEFRFAGELADSLYGNLGGAGELAQGPDEGWGSMAAFTGVDWELPGAFQDLFSAEFLWTAGRADNTIRAFTPVSGKNAGRVFDAGIGALMRTGLSYHARPLSDFSFEVGAAYFIRADLETLGDPDLDGDSSSRLLGGEVYGSLVWAPDPAFRLSAECGAFFPGLGGAYREDAPVKWKANLGLIVSL